MVLRWSRDHKSFGSLAVIVQIMGEELGWDQAERARQTREAMSFLETQMGKDVNKASQDNIPVSLTKAEIAEYVKRFNALDDGKKGYISINDIRKSLKVQSWCLFDIFVLFKNSLHFRHHLRKRE